MANTAELASETARQGPGLTRPYNDNTPMHYILFIIITTYVEDDDVDHRRSRCRPHG